MDKAVKQWQYEEKMDQIAEELEDLVLDAFIAVLQNLRQNNDLFREKTEKQQQFTVTTDLLSLSALWSGKDIF
jgi:hypothetical protein